MNYYEKTLVSVWYRVKLEAHFSHATGLVRENIKEIKPSNIGLRHVYGLSNTVKQFINCTINKIIARPSTNHITLILSYCIL